MKDKQGLNWEVSVGVTFASFMSAVTLFFTGILISQYSNFTSTVKVPLLFLIISTFSFIFSASIYSNAGIDITAGKHEQVKKYLIYANNIFEFLGLYLLIIATPLVITSLTEDSFLRLSTIIIALIGITLYSQSSFSILHKELVKKSTKILFTSLISILSALVYATSYFKLSSLFTYKFVSFALLLVLCAVTLFSCRNSNQYKEF